MFPQPQLQPYVTPLEMLAGAKHDVTGTPTGPYSHGNGGLFSQAGQDVRIFSAMLKPTKTILNALPLVSSDPFGNTDFAGYQAEYETIITGISQGNMAFGNQPTAACDRYPESGTMSICTLYNPYARYGGQVKSIDIVRQSLLRDPSDPTYMQVVNDMSMGGGALAPNIGGAGNIVVSEFSRRMFEAAVGFQRMLMTEVWVGDPATTTASNRYKRMMGLNIWINAGNKFNSQNGVPCAAADSDIKNFNYDIVSGGGRDIVEYLDMIYRWVSWNADQSGLDPVQWAWVMRPEAFDEIVKVFPVRYYAEALAQMAEYTNGRINLTGTETVAMRDDMRNNLFLPIRGQRIPVILDQGIPERNNVTTPASLASGQFASDIYLVPLTVRGGIPATYLKPMPMDNRVTEDLVREGRVLNTFTSDRGTFRFYSYQTGPCVGWDFETMFRLTMRTPFLAARITNVAYQPLQHTRDVFPGDAYYTAGGVTTGVPESAYLNSGTTPVVIS